MDENVITLVMDEKRWSRFSLHSLMPGKLAESQAGYLVHSKHTDRVWQQKTCFVAAAEEAAEEGWGWGGNPRKLERMEKSLA